MDGGGHDIGVRYRGGMQSGGDQSGEMRHIHPQVGAHLVGDLPERREILVPRIRRPTGDDHLRPRIPCDGPHVVHIHPVVFFGDPVGVDFVEFAGEVQPHPVGEVAAVGQIEAEQTIARIEQRHQHRGVGLRTGMRLHIREVGTEQRLGAFPGEILDHIDMFTAAVVAATGITLGVLVGEHTALGLQHCARNEVLRRDHLQGVAFAGELTRHRGRELRIELTERLSIDRGGRLRHQVSV